MPRVDSHTLNTLLRHKFKERPESTAVNDVEYNPETLEMTVIFQHRGTYKYYDIPLDVYVDFADSSSQGTYFNLYIRNYGYNYERIG
jgi:hypothetical protein